MSALALPYVESLQLVATAVREARTACSGGDKEAPAIAHNYLATGMEHLRGLARRYSASREARDFAAGLIASPRPIVSDAGFVRAACEAAAELEQLKDLVGQGGARVVAILRNWTEDKAPTNALNLAIVADTVMRAQKKKGSR